MTRLVSTLLVSAALLIEGCATHQTIPSDIDQQQLLAKVAQHCWGDEEVSGNDGRIDPNVEDESDENPDGSGALGKCAKVAMKVSATCMVLVGFGALCCLAHSTPSGTGMGNVFRAIWAED